MLRNLAALVFLLGACTAVTPAPTLPATAQATWTPQASPTPTISPTNAPVPTIWSATVAPTDPPPYKLIHRLPVALETINVLEAVCASRAETWVLYDYGMTRYWDQDMYDQCIEAKKI